MQNVFFDIHNYLKNHKILGFSVLAVYFIIVSFLAWNIKLEEDITKLIPSGSKQDLLKKVLKESDFSDKIIFSITAKNDQISPDSLVKYADELTVSFNKDLSPYIADVKGKVPEEDIRQVYDFVRTNLPVFLQENDYKNIAGRIEEDSIKSRISSGYRQLMSPTGFVTKDYFLSDPLSLTNFGLAKLQELQIGDNYSIYRNYLVTKDRRNILLFVDPVYPSSETDRNEEFVNKLDQEIERLNKEHSSVTGSYFGGVRYSVANANRIKSDIQLTLGIAVSVLLLLLIFFYRKFYIPILLFLPSFLAGVTAIALLSIFKGSVSAISLGIGAILLGITLDYALHILTHFRNNTDVKKLYRDITKPILMSSVTTAIAFLCLIFVKSEALNDLGIFAGLSVLFSSFFALIVIPLFYQPEKRQIDSNTFVDRIAAIDYSKIKPLVYGVTGLFLISLFLFNKVEFNSDLSQLNYQPEAIKSAEENIEALAGKSGKTIYMVAYGNSVDEALLRNNRLYQSLTDLEKEDEIQNFSSIGGVILSTATQAERIERWNEFWTKNRKDSVKAELQDISANYGFKPQTFCKFYDLLNEDFKTIGLNDYKKAGSLYLDDFISDGDELATVTSTVNLEEESAEDFLKYFEEEQGIIALDRKAMNQQFLGDLKEDFNLLILISIIAVFLVLLISYRNLEISLLTLLPIAVTWICALGIMFLLGIQFNILNIIISTFIFGLGLDYSIFITNASLNEYETGEFDLKTYQTSIIISVITTLLGMGALIFAQHPALRSISVVSIIGVLTAVSVSFIIQRALFRKLILSKASQGKTPFYLKKLSDVKGRISDSESEQLYRKRAVLDNYRYKSVYADVKRQFRLQREKNLRISRYVERAEKLAVINSGYGILPLFLSYKFENLEIYALERDFELLEISRRTARAGTGAIEFHDKLYDLSEADTFIISGVFSEENDLKKKIKAEAKKVILVDTDSLSRWLLDLNFEIIYRQNNILVFRKLD